jgi:hypothetical protein
VSVAADERRDRFRGAIVGLALAVVVFVANTLLFYFSIVFCRGENQQHYPSSCPPVDHHSGLFFEWGVVGVALVLPVLGFLGGARSMWTVGLGGLAVACWLVYFGSILVT